MGICTCGKKTSLFCFTHIKVICDDCILEHPICHVGAYLDWLALSECIQPTCAVCSEYLNEDDQTIRLKCHDIEHVRCLEKVLNEQATHETNTVLCPSCSASILPNPSDHSKLAAVIRESLCRLGHLPENLSHAQSLVRPEDVPSVRVNVKGTTESLQARDDQLSHQSEDVPSYWKYFESRTSRKPESSRYVSYSSESALPTDNRQNVSPQNESHIVSIQMLSPLGSSRKIKISKFYEYFKARDLKWKRLKIKHGCICTTLIILLLSFYLLRW
ncbi:zinc finger protein-like 1 [Schistocerca gregaria]|uniref:zinc finger protein-like 1 n=1 Tax=Schistocerca gregaria TaxID=7010 RepID=UPI00211DEDF1|nr:zinc finger protein-like 1 [Schistocerca gregaria]